MIRPPHREQYGIAPLVKLLEARPYDGVSSAAADAVRAVCTNNEPNKAAVRENWGIPMLTAMLEVRFVFTVAPFRLRSMFCFLNLVKMIIQDRYRDATEGQGCVLILI